MGAPCNWNVMQCYVTLLLYMCKVCVRVRGHPATEKYALLCYLGLLLYKLCVRGHPSTGNVHCYVRCYLWVVMLLRMYAMTLCDWKVCILLCCSSFVFVQVKLCMWSHPATEKCALLRYLFCYGHLKNKHCYFASFVCEDTLRLESMHCYVTCLVIVQGMCARTSCNWEVPFAVLLVLLYKCNLCVRGHSPTEKFALLGCYLFCYCARTPCMLLESTCLASYLFCNWASYVCVDALPLESLNCCVTCFPIL